MECEWFGPEPVRDVERRPVRTYLLTVSKLKIRSLDKPDVELPVTVREKTFTGPRPALLWSPDVHQGPEALERVHH